MYSQKSGRDMVRSDTFLGVQLRANLVAEFGKEKTVPLSGRRKSNAFFHHANLTFDRFRRQSDREQGRGTGQVEHIATAQQPSCTYAYPDVLRQRWLELKNCKSSSLLWPVEHLYPRRRSIWKTQECLHGALFPDTSAPDFVSNAMFTLNIVPEAQSEDRLDCPKCTSDDLSRYLSPRDAKASANGPSRSRHSRDGR